MAHDLLSTVGRELDERLAELRPARAEYEQLIAAAAAFEIGEDRPADGGASSPSRRAGRAPRAAAEGHATTTTRSRASRLRHKRSYGRRGAAQEAILAALQHGSHTASELVNVTALPAPTIRSNLHRLLKGRLITRARRGGRSAYTLDQSSPET